jgi:hypothetical protein
VAPAPSLSERIEAAIGLAQLDPRPHAGYQVEYVAHCLGRFVVELGGLRNNAARLQGSDAAIPWRISAARLMTALDTLQSRTAERPDAANVAAVARHCDGILEMLVEHVTGADVRSLLNLERWLEEHRPATTALFANPQETLVRP